MALKLTGSPQRVKAVGGLQQVAKDKVAANAVREADGRRREEDERRKGSRGSRKA